jgi:hypothetical protein
LKCPALLELGSALDGHINVARTRIMDQLMTPSLIVAAQQCFALYTECVQRARAAIHCWISIARRAGVIKDVRQMIARALWADRKAWAPAWIPLEPTVEEDTDRRWTKRDKGCTVC